ncbi:hypothetical protein MNBD_DELTA01-1901 [hydrothermal vent metagenome]|uniref:Uncharacterized protein n=1 Tax=hydrothermal vent metagenome TaxID=652676 RepID=A0A3B0QXK3_9ZZZZ
MWFKLGCKKCGEILSGKNCYDVNSEEGTSIARPWYADETGLNHTAIVCLECGTIHDTTPSLLKVFIGSRSPFKVNATLDPQNAHLLEGYKGKCPEAYRKTQLKHMGIPKDIIDALANRKII